MRKAIDAGYESTGSCVSGPEKGAMGIHYANGTLIGDGLIGARAPELLVYERKTDGGVWLASSSSSSPTRGMPATRTVSRPS